MPWSNTQSGIEIVTLCVGEGLRPGRVIPTVTSGAPLSIAGFPGALQAAFIAADIAANAASVTTAIADFVAGLAYAVTQGWLSLGDLIVNCQEYVLEQAGFAEGGGVAPTPAQSAQQLLNVCAAINATPGAAQFKLSTLAPAFVGTVGGNTFAPEDLVPAFGQALWEGWVRSPGDNANSYDLEFGLTAAGAAQAA